MEQEMFSYFEHYIIDNLAGTSDKKHLTFL